MDRYSGILYGIQAAHDRKLSLLDRLRQAQRDKLAYDEWQERKGILAEQRERDKQRWQDYLSERNYLLERRKKNDAYQDIFNNKRKELLEIESYKRMLNPEKLIEENAITFAERLLDNDMKGALEEFNKAGKLKIHSIKDLGQEFALQDQDGNIVHIPKTKLKAIVEIGREYQSKKEELQNELLKKEYELEKERLKNLEGLKRELIAKKDAVIFEDKNKIPKDWIFNKLDDKTYIAWPKTTRKIIPDSSQIAPAIQDLLAKKGFDTSGFEEEEEIIQAGKKIRQATDRANKLKQRLVAHIEQLQTSREDLSEDELAEEVGRRLGLPRIKNYTTSNSKNPAINKYFE